MYPHSFGAFSLGAPGCGSKLRTQGQLLLFPTIWGSATKCQEPRTGRKPGAGWAVGGPSISLRSKSYRMNGTPNWETSIFLGSLVSAIVNRNSTQPFRGFIVEETRMLAKVFGFTDELSNGPS